MILQVWNKLLDFRLRCPKIYSSTELSTFGNHTEGIVLEKGDKEKNNKQIYLVLNIIQAT